MVRIAKAAKAARALARRERAGKASARRGPVWRAGAPEQVFRPMHPKPGRPARVVTEAHLMRAWAAVLNAKAGKVSARVPVVRKKADRPVDRR